MKISIVQTPENEDINSLAVNHQGEEKELFKHLIENRTHFRQGSDKFSFSTANEKENPPKQMNGSTNPPPSETLNTKNPYKLTYQTIVASYAVMGGLKKELDSMRVTLVIGHLTASAPWRKSRSKLDMYEDKQVEKAAKEAAEKLDLRPDLIETDLSRLTDLLEEYRETQLQNEEQTGLKPTVTLSAERQQQVIAFLSQPELIKRLNYLIGQSGVIGEENSRIFLFGIAASYKMPDTLHALIQGSSGSGKTHLLVKISSFIPEEHRKHFTRVTEGSFYNYGMYDLQNTLICLEDLDGMKEDAYLAFRELQSRGMIISSTSGKDDNGNIRAFEKAVYGPIASMSCTTKGEVYEDNMNRCFLIAVDETKAQTGRIIQYQNQKASGQIDGQKEQQATQFIKDCVRMLKPHPVVNPYANQVNLPEEAHKIRRLNDQYQSYVKQMALIHQYRRKKDNQGRIIAEKEDLQVAADIMFDSIVLKIDELDGSLRLFYEQLKEYVKSKGEHPENYAFGQREIRQALHISKSQLQRYIHDLAQLEYIRQTGGHANRGYTYKILYWDNIEALRAKVKRHLQGQLDQLELLATHSNGSPDGSPESSKNGHQAS